MHTLTRRTFLSRAAAAGTLAAAPWRLPIGYAQGAPGPTRAFLRRVAGRADFDRRVFGSFLEHLGRAIYTGVYPIRREGLQADFARDGMVPFVDVVATVDATTRQAAVLALNRDLDGERELVLDWEDVEPTRVIACETLTGADLKAFNTFENPRRVVPQPLEAPAAARRMTLKLPPRSYTVVHLATAS